MSGDLREDGAGRAPLTPSEVARALRRHWRIPLVVGVLALMAVPIVMSLGGDTDYSSTAVLVVEDAETLPERITGEQQLTVVESDVVNARARELAGAGDRASDADVRAHLVEVERPQEDAPRELRITVSTTNRALAKPLADGQARAYVEHRRALEVAEVKAQQEGVNRTMTTLRERLVVLDRELKGTFETSLEGQGIQAEIRAMYDRVKQLGQYQATLAEAAIAPTGHAHLVSVSDPSRPGASRPATLVPLGLLMAIAAGVGVGGAVVTQRLLPDLIDDPEDAASLFGAPVLAVVPATRRRPREPAVIYSRGSPRARAFHVAAAMLESAGGAPSRLLVAAPAPSPSMAVAGVNVAVSLAAHGLRVTLVGTDDWHVPALETLGVTCAGGYGDLVQKANAGDLGEEVDDYLQQAGRAEGLVVLAPGNRRSVAPPFAVERLLVALEGGDDTGADVCVVLAPPPLDHAHTPVLTKLTGSVLWVVEAGKTSKQEAQAASERLALTGAANVGVVLVR